MQFVRVVRLFQSVKFSVSQLNPSILNGNFVLFLSLILSNTIQDGGICFEYT